MLNQEFENLPEYLQPKCDSFRFNKENNHLDSHFHCPKCCGKDWDVKTDGEYSETNLFPSTYQVCSKCKFNNNEGLHKNLSVNEEFVRMIICTPNICVSS